jgi:S-adenosylmethionine:tRNA ribosyltransferase-isomerase
MKLSEFDYQLPEHLIAQVPLEKRDASRLMVVDRKSGCLSHKKFVDILDYLTPNDLLVINESKVIHARLLGQRTSGGKVEIFLLSHKGGTQFECLVKATASKKQGMEFCIGDELNGKVLDQIPNSISFIVEFRTKNADQLMVLLEKYGHVPLPPYIRRQDELNDKTRYQTVYAKNLGSVASPTAGLHYSESVLEKIKVKGVSVVTVNLHVGLGTFQPMKADQIKDHKMHHEEFFVSQVVRDQIVECKKRGGRVFGVGTTSVRSLESAARGIEGRTDLYLYPGEKFHVVDAIQTNFHQPKSSLLVMMAAFMGKDLLFAAYEEAIRENYRFLSYGDAMLVL